MPFAPLRKAELFDRLAAGHAARITVVTPNLRLARELAREFDAGQAAKGLTVWETADILPLPAFVQRRYEDALYGDEGAALPMLLTGAQERELWEEAIRASRWKDELLDVPQTATRAAEAWRLAHAWQIAGGLENFPGSEDTAAFAEWAKTYAQRCNKENLADGAVLPDLVSRLESGKPRLLVAYAFDIVTPQAEALFASFGNVAACAPASKSPQPGKASFASPQEELESAARWARARLEAGAKRIGVVVPDLQLRRREVARVFSSVMRPAFNLPGAPPGAMPFNVSAGEPLAGFPLVAFALMLLEFSAREIEFGRISTLMRSPFLGGADTECAARALLDARLRGKAAAVLSLPKLIGTIERCPLLRARLERVYAVKSEGHSPHQWAQHFTALLEAAGFPGERTLDSVEFQTRAKLNQALADFACLERVATRFSFGDAVSRLRRICADTMFQPEGPDAPIQVLGILESAGLEFDALWVSGLTDGAWPLHARPDPFLPVALQKKAGIPEASAESSLELDRRITEGWAGAADEVVFSWPRKEADRDLAASPLIAAAAERQVAVPPFDSYRDRIFGAGGLVAIPHEDAVPVRDNNIRGGARVLADQSACPFRAFARHRLAAEGLDEPSAGPDAMARGNLLHALMAGIWGELKSSAALAGDVRPAIERSAVAAVRKLGLEGRFAELEVARLIRLAGEWLGIERGRGEFSVEQVEHKVVLNIGGLALNGRIDRLDRLADGSHALIDYKTGSRVTPNDWLGERPDDPQLPLYAVGAAEPISAVAFARLRAGEMKFAGMSAGKDSIPGVRQAKNWDSLMSDWKTVLQGLAEEFSAGEAQVDPKRGLATCRYCGLQPLCRVHEKLDAFTDEDGDGEGA